MPKYTLFFSWQNDRKDTKSIIFAALNKAKDQFAEEGIELVLDQDTRNRTGKRNIDDEVLQKIRNCDIFLVDLTPVITYFPPAEKHDLPKHMPNSNVMYEYGYALHAKGENRMIVLASLNKEEDEHIEYMPFDINHDTITLFTNEANLGGLHQWISKIMEDVEKERAQQVPKYDCDLLFRTDDGSFDNITIHPLYKKILYRHKPLGEIKEQAVGNPNILVVANSMLKFQETLVANCRNPANANLLVPKTMGDTTNLSYVPIHLVFVNKGSEALDHLKISIMSIGQEAVFAEENVKHSFPLLMPRSKYDISANEFGIFQKFDTINPHDSILFDEVFVHVPHDRESVTLHWSLNSRQHQAEGLLSIHVEPDYECEEIVNDNFANTEKVLDLVKENN